MATEGRPYGVRWLRLGLIGAALAVLNLAALALATVEAPFGFSGSELLGVAISVPMSPTPSPPPVGLAPPEIGRAHV